MGIRQVDPVAFVRIEGVEGVNIGSVDQWLDSEETQAACCKNCNDVCRFQGRYPFLSNIALALLSVFQADIERSEDGAEISIIAAFHEQGN